MNVIDVTIAGGPDLAALVARRGLAGGLLLQLTVANDGPVPARLDRVLVPIESPTVRRVLALGWDSDDAGCEGPPATAGRDAAPLLVTDQGTVGWLGARRHRGAVTIQRDGWLLTASAEMGGVLLGPGERLVLDSLWLGEDLPGYCEAWTAAHGAPREVEPVTGAVVGAGASPEDVQLALAELHRVAEVGQAGAGAGMLVAAGAEDMDAVARAAGRRNVRWGVVLAPFGGASVDPSRPGALERIRALGSGVAAGRPWWVVVVGAASALACVEWGRSSATPVAWLHDALAALREGLGPAPIVHVAGGPPAALVGVADVVDVGPGWPHPSALDAVTRRSPLHGVAWAASPGPLAYATPAAVLDTLTAVSGPRLLWPPALRPTPGAVAAPPAS